LVLSDLHAINDIDRARRSAAMNYAFDAVPRGLLTLARDAVLRTFPEGIDLMVCAGDITDKANGGPLSAVWEDLHWLAGELDVPFVATSGNHDYDSRADVGKLPSKSLQALEPPFPFGSEEGRDRYFARQHAVYHDAKVVVVTANSAAHHGYVPAGVAEHDFGRYDESLPDSIKKSLAEVGSLPPIRIFLTHHHLNQLPEFDLDERSASIGHENVVRGLADHGDWLIIHGHKHRGWLQYASGAGDAPPLFSASSFSADFGSGAFADKVRHQFHILEVDSAPKGEGITGAHGRVTTWILPI